MIDLKTAAEDALELLTVIRSDLEEGRPLFMRTFDAVVDDLREALIAEEKEQ